MDVIKERAFLTAHEQNLAGLSSHVHVSKINIWRILERTKRAGAEATLAQITDQALNGERAASRNKMGAVVQDRVIACAMAKQLLSLPCEVKLWPCPTSDEQMRDTV